MSRKCQIGGIGSRQVDRLIVTEWPTKWDLSRHLKLFTVAEALIVTGISFRVLGE